MVKQGQSESIFSRCETDAQLTQEAIKEEVGQLIDPNLQSEDYQQNLDTFNRGVGFEQDDVQEFDRDVDQIQDINAQDNTNHVSSQPDWSVHAEIFQATFDNTFRIDRKESEFCYKAKRARVGSQQLTL